MTNPSRGIQSEFPPGLRSFPDELSLIPRLLPVRLLLFSLLCYFLTFLLFFPCILQLPQVTTGRPARIGMRL